MSEGCTCTPNDVCYPCYARRRYDSLPDVSVTLEGTYDSVELDALLTAGDDDV